MRPVLPLLLCLGGTQLACNPATGPVGPQGPRGSPGQLTSCAAGEHLIKSSNGPGCAPAPITLGLQPSTAVASCAALHTAGVRRSGRYFIDPDGAGGSEPYSTYCEMELNGGGWALVYNSVLGINTTDFWYIPYAERLGRRGTPSLESNYYDGNLYRYGLRYVDLIEDLAGKVVIVLDATTTGMSTASMVFASPARLTGHSGIFAHQFASGWASPDFDGEPWSEGNCATRYANVSQHYGDCFVYNLGGDGDGTALDAPDDRRGPHLHTATATELGLANDGSGYTRVRRISRFARW